MAALRSVQAELRKLGTEQNRKIYRRHGASEPLHGVSFGSLRPLAKRLGTDHELATRLWASGNHDERMLATMIADPAAPGRRELDAWAGAVDNYMVSDALAEYVGRTPHLDSRAEKWSASRREFTAHTGWNLVAQQALSAELPDSYFREQLARIEAGMHDAPNRTRHAMQMTLISIGGRSKGLRRAAGATSKRLGTPEVDHGATNCSTPDAIPYIDRMWEHKERKAAKGRP